MKQKIAAVICGWFLVFMLIISAGICVQATGGNQQICNFGSNCTIGEFLFDDNYLPLNTGTTCTLVSRDPSGTIFVNSQNMPVSGHNDGWYSAVVSIGQTAGIYPSQMCCTTHGVGTSELMCLDKTFKVTAPTLTSQETADAVWNESKIGHTGSNTFGSNLQNATLTLSEFWNYSSRTLSIGSSLIQEIWDYTETSTNNFTNLIAKIWSNNSAVNLATKNDVTGIGSSLSAIENKIDTLDTHVNSIGSTVSLILTKWGSSSASDILTSLNSVTLGLGNSGDNCTVNSVFGNIACVRDKWGSQTAQGLYDLANNTLNIGNSLRSELNYNGRSTTAYEDILAIKNYVDSLELSIGSSSDTALNATLFGKIKGNQDSLGSLQNTVNSIDSKIDNLGVGVSNLISKWGTSSISDITTQINSLSSVLGSSADPCSESATIFGSLRCARDQWGNQSAETLYTLAVGTSSTINSLLDELTYSGKTTKAYQDLQSINTNIGSLSTAFNQSLASAVTSIKGVNDKDLSVLSGEVAGVQTSLNSLTTKVDNLGIQVSSVNTGLATLISKWGSLNLADVTAQIQTIQLAIGSTADVCLHSATIFGNITCLKDQIALQDFSSLSSSVDSLSSLIGSITGELTYSGKTTKLYEDLLALKTVSTDIQNKIGTYSDTSTTDTLFGRVKKIQAVVDVLNGGNTQINQTIDNWGTLSPADIYNKVKDLSSQISAINVVSNVSSILSIGQSNTTDLTALKNQLLSIQALINVNQTLLEKSVNQPVIKTWLEEGSIIFKTMITNPSSVTQKVPLKFYIPKEASKDDVLKIDSELSINYDPEVSAFYVFGEFTLPPKNTKIVSIEVTDVWKISDDELNSLRSQTNELFTPLKNTAYFAQGVTLKSDILVQLDNISRTQNEAITPESRIKTYRDNIAKLTQIKSEIKDLQTIVTSASSSNNLMGFSGGAQLMSVWVIMATFIVSVVLITVYVRTATGKISPVNQSPQTKHKLSRLSHFNFRLLSVIILAISLGIAVPVTIFHLVNKPVIPLSSLVTTVASPTPVPKTAAFPVDNVLGDKTIAREKIALYIPTGYNSIRIHAGPSAETEIINRLWLPQSVDKYQENGDWLEIGTTIVSDGVSGYIRGWINRVYLVINQ